MRWGDLKFWKSEQYQQLKEFLDAEEAEGKTILPPRDSRYRAFDLCPFNQTRVVILGQDPYPTEGHANGLAFSVEPHVRPIPRSLRNIYREYVDDLGFPTPRTGDLSLWARNGVLLLNTALTVERNNAGSHRGKGWESLTFEVVRKLSFHKNRMVFILWGKNAQEFEGAIYKERHLVIKSVHPSPLSARRGFFGSRPFSRAAHFLGLDNVIWRL